jgi:hypothetical protein
MSRRTVVVNDKMQRGYHYELVAPSARGFDPDFIPELTPGEMLRLGVFCGKYMTDTRREFPKNWFEGAKLAKRGRDCSLNYAQGGPPPDQKVEGNAAACRPDQAELRPR